jgi:hypothetical protein
MEAHLIIGHIYNTVESLFLAQEFGPIDLNQKIYADNLVANPCFLHRSLVPSI